MTEDPIGKKQLELACFKQREKKEQSRGKKNLVPKAN